MPRGRRNCATRPPRAGRPAPLHRHRLLQGHDDRVGGQRPDRHRRRRSRSAAGRIRRPGRPAGRPVQRHLHHHGHRPEGPGPPHRHLHVELPRGAGARPPPMQVTVLRLGWNPKASTPRLVDRLFRQREGDEMHTRRLPSPSRPSPLEMRSRSGSALSCSRSLADSVTPVVNLRCPPATPLATLARQRSASASTPDPCTAADRA